MASCAACQKPFTKEQRGLKCTLCAERRVAEPAYYCNRACQKQHWSAHKAWHALLAAELGKSSGGMSSDFRAGEEEAAALDVAVAEKLAKNSHPHLLLCAQADEARLRGDFKTAVKLAKKAIATGPPLSISYQKLALVYADSGDFTSAVPHCEKAMELAATGNEVSWAYAASILYMCSVQTSCVAPKPAWLTDPRQLKRATERAAAALPADPKVLQMRGSVYVNLPLSLVTADDLQQAMRDGRKFRETLKEGPAREHARLGQLLEAKLRDRITADVGAMKFGRDASRDLAEAERKTTWYAANKYDY